MAEHAHTSDSAMPAGWLAVVAVVLVFVTYATAVSRQQRADRHWSNTRVLWFFCGCALLAVALSPPISDFAHRNLSGHMAQHLTIGMMAPLGLVLGAPATLLFRVVPVDTGRDIAKVLRSRPSHILSHPMTALVLNIGGMYVLYLSPLFAASMSNPIMHGLVNVHFLLAGYLYIWSIVGPDPAPRRPGFGTRLSVLVVSVAAHAYLGKIMYAHLWPRGTDFTVDEIRQAAQLMYYGGDITELLLAVALFATWYQQRRRARLRALKRDTAQKNGHTLAPVVHAS